MARWIVLASLLDAEASSYRTLAELDGSAEEAMAALREEVNTYDRGVMKMVRREVFECSERSYFVRVHGRLSQSECFIQLCELVADTGTAALPDAVG
ncbi:hypothetical protein [Streptomyces lancefieldiae]|uniref:Uncharacterized protein n=1 Tax=Streptomyces lancefieldiae TaxID=3075520 RepID=A0ABU3B0G7_9ACTN|nr:hypothetical protein [Streptomyces sp. DSM 40712]MDT0615949.1 hypothetical protein [Streptomyces sp. DSM 40712]